MVSRVCVGNLCVHVVYLKLTVYAERVQCMCIVSINSNALHLILWLVGHG